jgi:ATP-dependent RNA helicase DeaD
MPDLGLVIHADLPQNREALLHRSGRTGRAGRKGMSVMVVPASQRRTAERLLAAAKIKATWSPAPSAEAIRARDDESLVQEIAVLAATPAEDDLAAGRLLLAQRSPEELAAALVRLRRELLPAPEVLEDVPSYQGAARTDRHRPPVRKGRYQPPQKPGKKRWKSNRHST